LPTFRHNLSVLSSRVAKSDKKDKKTLADGTDMLFENVGKVSTTSLCVISQKSADLTFWLYIGCSAV